MKAFVISDNTDTAVGMRLAGFEGEVISERAAILKRLEQLVHDPQMAIVLMTTGVIRKVADVVSQYKLIGTVHPALARPSIGMSAKQSGLSFECEVRAWKRRK